MHKHPHTNCHSKVVTYFSKKFCVCACFPCNCRWLHGLIDTYTEPNPDKAEVPLPMGMKSDVHNMYMEEVCIGGSDLQPVSDKYFNTVWRERVPQLKVRIFHRCVHMYNGVLSCQPCSVTCSFFFGYKQLFSWLLAFVHYFQISSSCHTFTLQVCRLWQVHRDQRSLAPSYQ